MSNEMVKQTVFLGKKVRKYYTILDGFVGTEYNPDNFYEPKLSLKTETLAREEVLRIDGLLDFKEKEEIYLEELDRYTVIEKKTHSTKGNIIYNITYVTLKELPDEIEANKLYNQKLKEFKKSREQLLSKIEERNKERQKQNELKKQKEDKEYEKLMQKKSKIKKKGIIINRFDMSKLTLQQASTWHRFLSKHFLEFDILTIPNSCEVNIAHSLKTEPEEVKELQITNPEIWKFVDMINNK